MRRVWWVLGVAGLSACGEATEDSRDSELRCCENDAVVEVDAGPSQPDLGGARPDTGLPGSDGGRVDGSSYEPGAPAAGDPEVVLMTGLRDRGDFREVRQGMAVDWTCPIFDQGGILGHLEAGIVIPADVADQVRVVAHRYWAESETGQTVARDEADWSGGFLTEDPEGNLWFDQGWLIIPSDEVGTNNPNLLENEPLLLQARVELADGRTWTRSAWIETDFDCPVPEDD